MYIKEIKKYPECIIYKIQMPRSSPCKREKIEKIKKYNKNRLFIFQDVIHKYDADLIERKMKKKSKINYVYKRD